MADIPFGELKIPVGFNVDRLKREEKKKLEKAVSSMGRDIGKTVGDHAAKDILDALEKRFKRDIGEAREELARGLIDRKEFEKRGREAAKRMNDGILDELEKRGRAGKLGKAFDDEFIQLTSKFKDAGEDSAEQFQEPLERTAKWVKFAWAGAIAAGVAVAIGMLGRLARKAAEVARFVRDTLRESGTLQAERSAFRSVAASTGFDPDELVSRVSKAFRGLVTEQQVMRTATQALQAELPLTIDQLEQLAAGVSRIAESRGQDAPDLFDRLINGMAKMESEILEQLGIITTLESALRSWEDQTGGNADSLNQMQRRAIFTNAVLDEMSRKVDNLGDETFNARRPIDQISVALDNFKNRIVEGVGASPQLVSLLQSLGSNADDLAESIDGLATNVLALFDTMADAGARTATFWSNIAGSVRDLPLGPFAGLAGGLIERAIALPLKNFDANKLARELGDQIESADIGEIERIWSGITDNPDSPFSEEQIEVLRIRTRERMQIIQTELDFERNAAEAMAALPALQGTLASLEQGNPERSASGFRTLRVAIDETMRGLADGSPALAHYQSLLEEVTAAEEKATQAAKEQASARKQATERLKGLEQQMQDRVLALTSSVVDDLQAALLRELEEARETARTAGVELSQEFLDGWQELWDNSEDLRLLEGFQNRLRDAGDLSLVTQQLELTDLRIELENYLGTLDDGTVVHEQALDLLRKLEDQYRKNAKALRESADIQRGDGETDEDRAKELRALREKARLIEQNARAAIKLADAVGLIGSEAAASFDSIISLVSGLQQLTTRDAAGNLDFSALPIVLGSVAQLASGFFGDSAEEKARRQRQIEALNSLEDALRSLEDAIQPGKDLKFGDRALVAPLLEGLREGLEGNALEQLSALFDFDNLTDAQKAALKRVEEALGIDILETLKDLDPQQRRDALDDIIASFNDLDEALNLDTVGGSIEFFRHQVEQLDLETAAEQFRLFNETVLERLTPEFARRLGEFDTSTAEGQEGADDFVAQLTQELLTEGITDRLAELFGTNVSASDILAILSQLDGFLDGLDGELGSEGETQSHVQARSITQVEAGRITSSLFSLTALAHERNDLLRIMAGDMLQVAPVSSAQLAALDPAVQASAATGPVQVAVRQSFGDINLSSQGGIIDDSQVRQVFRDSAHEIVTIVDRELKAKQDRKARALGLRAKR